MGGAGGWEPVAAFDPPNDRLDALVRALGVAAGDVARFRAGALSAVVLPGPVLALDPPDVDAALRLAARLGDDAGPVVLALPAGLGPQQTAGLVPEPGQVAVTQDGSTVEYLMYRVTARTGAQRSLAAGTGAGVGPERLDDRARWFDTRHGRSR